jgi:hypothetical protein
MAHEGVARDRERDYEHNRIIPPFYASLLATFLKHARHV